MKLILLRHVEMEENVRGKMLGWGDGTISKRGQKQTLELAERFKGEKINAIYSGNLPRQMYTANTIRRYHSDIPFHEDKRLREINLGFLQGKSNSGVRNFWESSQDISKKPKGGESLKDVYNRVENFYKEICDRYTKESILAVSSKFPIQILRGMIEGSSFLESLSMGVKPAEIIEFEINSHLS